MKNIPTPIFQKKLPSISWKKIYVRDYGVQYSEGAILCLSNLIKTHIPKPSIDQVVIPEGPNTAFYIDETAWRDVVESLNAKYTKNLKKLIRYERELIRLGKEYVRFCKTLANLNLKSKTDKQLKRLYQQYQTKLFEYSVYAWTSFIINNFISEEATSILDRYQKQNNQNSRQDILDSLFTPDFPSTALRLQYAGNKLQGNFKSNVFTTLYEKYKWLSCLDLHNSPWTRSEFQRYIVQLPPINKKKIKLFSFYAKKLHIKKNDLSYLFAAKRFVYIKDVRDDFRRQGVFYALSFFGEIARRMKIHPKDSSFLQISDISTFLDGHRTISQKLVRNRKKGFVSYLDVHKNLVCLAGKDVKIALSMFHLTDNSDQTEEIKGQVASSGIARGVVRIVKGVKDIKKVKTGNILVAPSTHPDYVSAMRKAAAIVTDEGGITSHAAIVSREFGIPCIVGTGNATKVLNNGQMVEVDATKGMVKIVI